MPILPIRYWLAAFEVQPPGSPKNWSDWAYEYLIALESAGLYTRANSMTGLPALNSQNSRWYPLAETFGRPLDSGHPFINLVCTFGATIQSYWTAGIPNVLITGCEPRKPNPPEVRMLGEYQYLLTPREDWAAEIAALKPGPEAPFPTVLHLPAESDRLKDFFERISQ